jgi:hypothetical protein
MKCSKNLKRQSTKTSENLRFAVIVLSERKGYMHKEKLGDKKYGTP